MMTKNLSKALFAVRMCRSWRGHDFDVVNGARTSVGKYAKRITTRAARRLDKALQSDTE